MDTDPPWVPSIAGGFSLHWALGDLGSSTRLGPGPGTVSTAAGGAWRSACSRSRRSRRRRLGTGARAGGSFAGGIARRLSIFAGMVLAIHGVVLTAVGLVALTGVLGDPSDPASLTGHALLWDPLFAMWGVLLLLGRVDARRRVRGAEPVSVGCGA